MFDDKTSGGKQNASVHTYIRPGLVKLKRVSRTFTLGREKRSS